MSKNYKDTLLMPQTNFEMRANLTQKEKLYQQHWQHLAVYQKLIKANQNHQSFILHDGPPYANGDLHLGHALNKILKDIIIRYYNSNGYYSHYIPGWDTHGLPIETAVTNSGVNRKTISITNFRNQCQVYAQGQVENQINQFKQLGLLTDFKDCYLTFNKSYEAQQIAVFAQMIAKKLIYRNLYPVFWSPSSESALAEAEVEYLPKTSVAIYVAFPLILEPTIFKIPTALVIWTTTPWTIPANQLLAVHQDYQYCVIKVENQQYIVALDCLASFIAETKIEKYDFITNITGKKLLSYSVLHPLYERKTAIVHGNHVTKKDGTGIVHTAPCFGEDDFALGLIHLPKILCPLDDRGYFTNEINDADLQGLFYDDTNKIIVEKLKTKKALLAMKWFKHQYPHDWRTKKPVIYRATLQWFIAIEKIKPQLIKNIKNINFYDWCISRQRAWGVPIPIFYTEKKTPILDFDLIMHISQLFLKHGSNIWFEKSALDLLPANYQHPESPNGIFYKEQDIMDVWYDSGVSHLAVIKSQNLKWPVDLYLEGNDQFRGWFNSSLVTATITNNQSPYKSILAHGFVTDAKGNKMSKSVGNVISLQDICQQYGADILRLWVASVDFRDDIRIGTEILKQISETYRKIRNLLRFLLGNLFDFDVNNNDLENDITNKIKQLAEIDQYLLIKLNDIVIKVTANYQKYQFNAIYHLILNFITNDLSAFYCDFTKDILYASANNDLRRKQVQTTMFYILKTLLGLLAPILPHTCEEAFHSLYGLSLTKSQLSIHLVAFPQALNLSNVQVITKKWDLLMQLRNDINYGLEQAKIKQIIKNGLEALITINFTDLGQQLTTISAQTLAQLLIVSSVIITNKVVVSNVNSSLANINISLQKGIKCPRCWLVVTKIKNDVCIRCAEVLNSKM